MDLNLANLLTTTKARMFQAGSIASRRLMLISVVAVCTATFSHPAIAQQRVWDDLTLRDAVKRAMENGCAYLRSTQNDDGSWQGSGNLLSFRVGVTSLAVMAQINCDIPVDSPEVQRGLDYLRSLPVEGIQGHAGIYETSLAVMALCAADQLDRDLPRIQLYARLIEQSQEQKGPAAGYWGYQISQGGTGFGGDASNGQYAVLALRDAAMAGAKVSRETWQMTQDRWLADQLPNGGWAYNSSDRKTRGSMTVAGLSTIAITSRMLQDDRDVDAEGRPDCCLIPPPNLAMENGRRWMADNFSVVTNPGHGDYYFYYLYGLERAGRMSGMRFFGRYDWYRLGAQTLVEAQLPGGDWLSPASSDRDPVLNTSMALMFLSKGLSRVVINKLDYNSPNGESREAGEWNRHPYDIMNLVDLIDTLPRWPPRLTSQVVTMSRLKPETAIEELNQAPVLFISGRDAPVMTDQQIAWLRGYVDAGGFIFAMANCDGQGFDQGFRDIVKRMFPQGDASLQKLQADHPVFRSEYLLNSEGINLHGVDFGCRTSIIYSPDDIGCLWQKWMKHEPKERNPDLSQRILRATRIGVNVIAYATGREPPEKLSDATAKKQNAEEHIERGLLQIAKIRHTGGWDTAPRALRNLLTSLNETVGVAASTRVEAIPPTEEELSRFPIVYMHGRYRFQLPAQQQEALREYLKRGGVLFADSCCGSTQFDRSFRDLIRQLYPDQQLKEIPADHEMFTATVGHEIKEVTRRRLVPGEKNAAMSVRMEKGPPLFEGIEVDGRYAVIYSKYDLSCALEHQASLSCDGYVEEDAAKLAVNVVLYAMLQDISWSRFLPPSNPAHSDSQRAKQVPQ
ncbi:MAG: DUF4159 domain-containing protein [Planctomycetaceae bacterium]